MKTKLKLALVLTALTARAFAGIIDFESYTSGETLTSQPAVYGVEWTQSDTLFYVADDGLGNQFMQSAPSSQDPAVVAYQNNDYNTTSSFFGAGASPADTVYTGAVAYSFDISVATVTGSGVNSWSFLLADNNWPFEKGVVLSLNSNGDLSYSDGGISVTATDAITAANTFTTISGVIDYATNTYSLNVDGSLINSSVAFTQPMTGAIKFRAQSNRASDDASYMQLGIDNFSLEVVTIPEPTSFMLMLGGFALLFVGVKRRKK